jgi:nucleoside-diphosphate-sugar epimerase
MSPDQCSPGSHGSSGQETTVLVTGSSGALGSAIAAAAAAQGWAVRGVDRVPGRWTTVVGDLREPSVRRAAVAGMEAVVHVAALHAPQVAHVPDAVFRAINVSVTEALLEESARRPTCRFIYTSSTSVYGHSLVPSDRTVWVNEDVDPRPRDIYDETKLAAESLVTASPGSAVVLRVARCFPEPLPLLALYRLHRGVGLSDVAAAHVIALAKPDVTGVYNIAGPLLFDEDDVIELYQSAAAAIRRRAPVVAGAFDRRGWLLPDRLDRVYDSRAAGRSLSYEPHEGVLELLSTTWHSARVQ